uniref:Uncharacterized protein n=1 Tax=Echeneis naucrates TaxID=173247 RepID=A0A665WZP0_ECHNA
MLLSCEHTAHVLLCVCFYVLRPPPGRSTGIISFIGPTFGYIEREDLEKFTFSFDAFFGNPKAMTPGVRVHFTQNSLIATDVKVAPGGTENVDTEIYEAVVILKDSTVTLLKNDQVLINLLTDIVTEKRRATNIKPKIPATFSHTKEKRELVRFNIATHQETKEERATYVEILPDSFEESTEQRRNQGIVIEFSEGSGLIKCTQNPQLFFHMSEVIEKKKLELNEKVEFSVVPHETAEGGNQAIRIKRYTESVFFPVRKLGGVGTNKGKVREQTFLSRSRSRGRGRSKSKSKSRSPSRDQFGRVIQRRRSSSIDRDRKSTRYKQSRERSHRRTRSRTKSRSRSQSRSSSRSRSRSRDRSKDRAHKRRSKISRDHEDSHKRRREVSPLPRRSGVVDDELARKKRELEELNEMIAYKKSLVDIDPRALDSGQRTCIDYNHGRIAIPLTEYKPVRSILKKRPEGPEYHHLPPQPYDNPYYDSERYGGPYASRPYADHYSDHLYESHLYAEPSYGGPPSTTHRYTDRYDVYDEPYDDHYCDSAYADRPYDDSYRPEKVSHSPEPHGPSTSSQSAASTQSSLTHSGHSGATSTSQATFRPPSPTEPPPKSPSPKSKIAMPRHSPPTEKPPLDRFLDMLNKKNSEPVQIADDLLPHERALQDGGGFSRIVGLTQEQPSRTLEGEKKQQSPKRSSVERTNEDSKSMTEPYDKIQTLLRTIGLKLSTGDVSKLASRAQEKIYSTKSSSTEREIFSSPKEELRTKKTGSVESDHIHSPSPVRSSSLEPLNSTSSSSSPKPPPGPPPAQYHHPPIPTNWSLGVPNQISPEENSPDPAIDISTASQPLQRFGFSPGPHPVPPPRHSVQSPPGPPPGPLPRRPTQPPCTPHSVLTFIGQTTTGPSIDSCNPFQPSATVTPSPATSSTTSDDQSAISTTVARCLKVIETVKSLAAHPTAKPVKSVQFSLPTESPSASIPQTSAETEDDIKAKQKEKPISNEPRNVWICGHSLVYWAESRARSPEVGMQLGMDPSKVTIWWKGTQGITWSQLLPQLHQLKVTWPNPDILIMHLGGNDLSTDSPTDLLASVKKDLTSMRSIFPQCLLVWSNILPRRAWRHSNDSHEVDLIRTTVNRRIQNIISELGGTSLAHDNIRCGANTGLYRADGVHLSPKGIDVFNLNLQDFLEKWEMEINKTSEQG